MNVRIIAPNKVRVIAKQENVPAIKDFTEMIARKDTALMIALEKASVILKQGSVIVLMITRVKIALIKSVWIIAQGMVYVPRKENANVTIISLEKTALQRNVHIIALTMESVWMAVANANQVSLESTAS
jgi:hypothetical protein